MSEKSTAFKEEMKDSIIVKPNDLNVSQDLILSNSMMSSETIYIDPCLFFLKSLKFLN
jgi:hypothetical protein